MDSQRTTTRGLWCPLRPKKEDPRVDLQCIRWYDGGGGGVRGKISTYLCDHYYWARETHELTSKEAENILHRIMWNRDVPETRCQNFAFCMAAICRCVCTFMCPPCPPCIIQKVAFSPPKSTYAFVRFGATKNCDYRLRLRQDVKYILNRMYPLYVHPLGSQLRCFFIPPKSSLLGCDTRGLACVYYRSQDHTTAEWMNRGKTVLVSHTNAEDLGLMVGRIISLGNRLSVDVVAYDYSGYGRSRGTCSERTMYKDVERVYEFMVDKMKIPYTQIVAIGTSLGSAATAHLASRRPVRAVVLQGTFSSALRTLCPDQKSTSCMDRFATVDKVARIAYPTLFIHGENDKMFGVEHLLLLRAECPGASAIDPLIVKGGEHCDFEDHETYWQRLKHFFEHELEAPPPVQIPDPSPTTESSSTGASPEQRSTKSVRSKSLRSKSQ